MEEGRGYRYRREELLGMDNSELREICERERIIRALRPDCGEEERRKRILSYFGSGEQELITEISEKAVGRLECFFRELRFSPLPEDFESPGELCLYRGAGLDFSDRCCLSFREELINTNAFLLNGEGKLEAVLHVNPRGGEREFLYLRRGEELFFLAGEKRRLRLILLDQRLSALSFRLTEKELSLPVSALRAGRAYERSLLCENPELLALSHPIALSFGSMGSSLSLYSISSPSSWETEPGISHTHFPHWREGELHPEAWVPNAIYVRSLKEGAPVLDFGWEALARAEESRSGGSLFRNLRAWILQPDWEEALFDREGNYRRISRFELLLSFLRYLLERTRAEYKCRTSELCLSAPLPQREAFRRFLERAEERLSCSLSLSLSEAEAGIFRSIFLREKRRGRLPDGDYRALLLSVSGLGASLSECGFSLHSERGLRELSIRQSYRKGDPRFGTELLLLRLMQFLQLRIEEALPGERGKIPDPSGGERGRIPICFWRCEGTERQPIRKNFYFLRRIASELLEELLFSSFEPLEPFSKDGGEKARPAENFQKLSFLRGGRLSPLRELPRLSFSRTELSRALREELDRLLKDFLEEDYEAGELFRYDMISLLGGLSRSGLFRESLKEFIPGRMMEGDGGNGASERTALSDALLLYQLSLREGSCRVRFLRGEIAIPCLLFFREISGRESILLDGRRIGEGGSIRRNLSELLLPLCLRDLSGRLKRELSYSFFREEAEEIGREELLRLGEGRIRQEDTDDIRNGELGIFAFFLPERWSFSLIGIFRREDRLFAGPEKIYAIEEEEDGEPLSGIYERTDPEGRDAGSAPDLPGAVSQA